jgi:molybdopterin-containing oxidoreductase family membrane subunit
MIVSSSFHDGQVEHYVPRLPEILLGLGGVGVAFLMTAVGVRVLKFLPEDDLAHLDQAAIHQGD